MAKNPFPLDQEAIEAMLEWTKRRIKQGPDPRAGAQNLQQLDKSLGGVITADGMDDQQAFALFSDVIVPSTRPMNHPTSLSFVAAAPTPASLGFDAALSSAEIFAGNWDGASGAIYAENQALAWLAGLAGWPASAGGVFVAGGTNGNLSALHAARVSYKKNHADRPDRWRILCSAEAHSSIAAVASVMDAELVKVDVDDNGCMDMQSAEKLLDKYSGVFAIVGNAGATNCGAIDNLKLLGEIATTGNIWFHVDGAYGLAALADPEARQLFDGIELADSFIVDPHKWLFAPYDSCALVYRDPLKAAQAHGQKGPYLSALDHTAWNPSDYALHLTRRARGLPLWFSLVTYGTSAFAAAIAQTRSIAAEIAAGIDSMDGLHLILGPQLTVILFRPVRKTDSEVDQWSEEHRRSGSLLCLSTNWHDEKVLRLCIVNPQTDAKYVLEVLKTLC